MRPSFGTPYPLCLHEDNELKDKMPAGDAAEYMVHLGFVGQANMCVGHRQRLFLFLVTQRLNKMFCCGGENLSRACSLCCFYLCTFASSKRHLHFT